MGRIIGRLLLNNNIGNVNRGAIKWVRKKD